MVATVGGDRGWWVASNDGKWLVNADLKWTIIGQTPKTADKGAKIQKGLIMVQG